MLGRHDRGHSGISDEERKTLCGLRRVERHVGRADAERGEHRDRQFGRPIHEQPDAIVRSQA